MSVEDPLRQRYLLRLKFGVGILVLMALPTAYFSFLAIDGLFNRPAQWVPDSIPVKAEFNRFVKHFSAAELVTLAWEGSDLDSPGLARSAELLRPLCEESYDADTDSETLAGFPDWARAEVIAVREVAQTATPLAWVRTGSEALQQITSSPVNLSRRVGIRRLQGSLVGPDGKQTCLVVSLGDAGLSNRRAVIPAVRSIAGRANGMPAGEIAIVGGPFNGATVDAASIRTIQVFSPPSAILAAVLCLICLRSVPLTVAIVAVAVLGEGLVLAAVYATGVPMNAVLIVLPPLIFVLTVSAGIHLSNYYLDAAHEFPELSRASAAQLAMKVGVSPCLLATGTTVVGLSSLMLVRLEPVRIFGGVASFGVVATLALLLLILPGAMVMTAPRRASKHDAPENEGRAIKGFARSWMRRRLAKPWPLISAFFMFAVALSFGLTRLESTVSIPRMFQPGSDIRRQYDWFEEHVGPTVTGELLLTFPPLGDRDNPLDRLDLVKQAHVCALKQEAVEGVLSPMTFIPSVPRQRSFRATARRSAISKMIRDPDSSLGKLGFIARDANSEIWRISVRIPQSMESDYSSAVNTIRLAVEEQLSGSKAPVTVSFTGHVVILQTSQEILLSDLFRSFMTAFGVIALVMILMLRSVIGGLVAMAPNLFPTVALFGLMGLVRVPLDIGTVMSASVALGIAVDDTVHLLSRFGSRRARGIGQIRAAYGALAQCGWAMFHTTLVCGLSLLVYWLSDFVPTSLFSLSMAGLLSAALLGVVFLLPALMSTFLGRWLARTVGADATATLSADASDPRPPPDVRRLPTRWQSTHSS